MLNKLQVNIQKAYLTYYPSITNTMDPYVILSYNQQTYKSEIKRSTDMPEWNEKYQYLLSNKLTGNESNLIKNINKYNELIIIVKDLKTLGNDGIIGQVKIDLNKQLLTQNIVLSKWYSLKNNKKPAGKIMLNIKINSYLLGYGNQIHTHTRNNNLIKNINDYQQNNNEIQKNKSQIRFRSNSKKSKLQLVMNSKNQQIFKNNLKRDYSTTHKNDEIYYTGFKGAQSPQKTNKQSPQKTNKITKLKSTLISNYNRQQYYQNANIQNYKKVQDFRKPIQLTKNQNDNIKKIPYHDLISKGSVKNQSNNKNVIFSFCS